MAKLVLRDAFIEVAGVDMSCHVSSVEINLVKDEIETTSFCGVGRERVAGLKDDSITLNFQQDYAAGMVDDTLFPLWDDESEFVIRVRPTQSLPVGPDNPEYSGTFILLEYAPLSGSVGELSETEVTFPAQRDGITRSTEGS